LPANRAAKLIQDGVDGCALAERKSRAFAQKEHLVAVGARESPGGGSHEMPDETEVASG